MSVLILGASGYIGRAFVAELERRNVSFGMPTRKGVDGSYFDDVYTYLSNLKPEFVINAAGYAGKPNVDTCEIARADTLVGNLVLPQAIAHACAMLSIPWGHVSSGCIYNGPDDGDGYAEYDEPNFSFRKGNCSFYSGTKALCEDVIFGVGQCYIWRLRLPFDEHDGPRNYLSKLQRYEKVYDNLNSLSHRGDFVKACLDLWEKRAQFGIYNMTNPGAVTARQVVGRIRDVLKIDREFKFWENDEEFYKEAIAPRSNCVLNTDKLAQAGVVMRPVEEAVEDSLRKWIPE